MPQDEERRQRPAGPPKHPQTLSLPIIPSSHLSRPTGSARAVRPDASSVSRPRTSASVPRIPALLPTADAWDDAFTDLAGNDDDDAYSYDVASRATSQSERGLMARPSQSLGRTSGRQLALGPAITPPLRLGTPPPRPLRRTLAWQLILVLVAVAAIFATVQSSTPPVAAYASAFQAKATSKQNVRIVDQVPIQTQLDPTIGYDSPQQYKDYSSAACGAAATSSVLLAWGDPNGHIGQVIDDMKPYIQTTGMVDPINGFKQVGLRHHFNVTMTNNITAAQLAYIVQTMGIPVVVGIRDNNGGYYRYFDVGHFLVIVGADANGFQVVDNSTYFVHYFPTATFLSLWDYPRATIYTPQNYTFVMP